MKKNRFALKLLALASTLALLFSLAACSSGSSTAPGSAPAGSTPGNDGPAPTANNGVTRENIKFGFLAPSLQTEFMIGIDDGLKVLAAEEGWEYTSVSFNGDTGMAVTSIENMVTAGCNVILAMVSDNSCDDALRAAQQAGAIIMECGVETEVYDICMNSSQYDVGVMISDMAGAWINDQLGGEANIVVYTTLQDNDMQERGQGIQDRIQELCPNAKILEVVDIGKDIVGSGTATTETMLQKYPEMNVILAYGDASATEAVEAVKAAGRNSDDFGIFACDGTAGAIDYIANNDVMRGTLQFGSIADMTRDILYEYLDGKNEGGLISKATIYPITIENAADFQ